MRKTTLLVLMVMLPWFIAAQTKILTIEEATGMNRKLFPASLSQLQWTKSTDQFAWVSRNSLVLGSVNTDTRDTVLRLDTLNSRLKAAGIEPLKSFPSVSFTTPGGFFFTSGGTVAGYDLSTGKAAILNTFGKNGENADLEQTGWKVAFTRENNLFISRNGTEIAVTKDENPGIVSGRTVHRNEFGIEKGTFWSPGGNLLAFYRMDESMVTEYPLVDISKRIAEPAPTRYPMAGMASHHVTIGIFDPLTSATTWIKTEGPADQYLTNITWSPDEKYLYVAVLNRDQNHMWLNQYEVSSGKYVKTLFEETSEKYVEPMTGMYFVPDHSGRFIWQSQRDGFNHLYLYHQDGTLAGQLTKGNWVVKDFAGFSADGATAYFSGNDPDPLGNQFYAIELKTGKRLRITREPGTHRVLVSPDGNYFLDAFNSFSVPGQVNLLDKKGMPVRTLLEPVNPLKDFRLGETSVFTLKSDDQTDLYCRMIKPAAFDPARKYPVIIYVYGGPHSQLITDSWLGGAGLWLNYLAQQGFVVFTLDNRGTSNRGAAFEQAIFRNLGTLEMADQMKGVAYLKSLSWVDTARIGLNGWSYGGFVTLSMHLRNPGVFKVTVAGGPVIDWKYYEVMYGERYMDTPETNPDGYDTACLLNYVKNLKGRVLVINGDIDNTVVPQNALSFLKKCVDEGIQADYFIYPGHEHNVRGKDRVHLNRKITDYFLEHL
jgi:dipeptidyl-peptidase-4